MLVKEFSVLTGLTSGTGIRQLIGRCSAVGLICILDSRSLLQEIEITASLSSIMVASIRRFLLGLLVGTTRVRSTTPVRVLAFVGLAAGCDPARPTEPRSTGANHALRPLQLITATISISSMVIKTSALPLLLRWRRQNLVT